MLKFREEAISRNQHRRGRLERDGLPEDQSHLPGLERSSPELKEEEMPPALRAKLFEASLPTNHPIVILRNAAQHLFAALEAFTAGSTREPAAMGFRAPPQDTVRVDALLRACEAAVDASTPVVLAAAIDEGSLLFQSEARGLRLLAKRLQGFLIFNGYRNGIPEDQLPGAVQECLEFQSRATEIMNQLSSLACGVALQEG